MWHILKIKEVAESLKTNIKSGLAEDEILKRRNKYGVNKLKEKKKESIVIKFIKQFNDFMIIILIIASIISAITSYIQGENDYFDSIIIIAIVVLNAIMGLVQEEKAEKSIESLKKLTPQIAKTIRNGGTKEVNAEELVPGDIIELEAGNYVPADCRIIECFNLKIEESSLTGETEPVEKNTTELSNKKLPLGDMINMGFMGSIVISGHGKAIVTETGMNTKIGKISIIEENNLKFEIKSEEYDEEIEAGKIISQDPAFKPNYSIKEKSTISVVVSKGQKIVTVPKVTGKEIQEAEDELTELGLKVEIQEEESKKVEEGYVIKQDLAANTEVNAGSTIILTVSKGVEMVVVPNLIGKTQAEAQAEIENAGLTLNSVVNNEDTTKTDGVVLKQNLDIGSSVEKGTGITITVNKIEALIDGTVTVNLKSLIKYTGPEENTNNTTVQEPQTVKLQITVDDDSIYTNESERKDATNVKASFSGKGTVTIRVKVNGDIRATKTLNLKESTSITIE